MSLFSGLGHFGEDAGKFVKKTVRYSGAATAAVVTGGFVPQSRFRKVFGLSPGESKQAEIGLKVTRGITAAVLTAGAAKLAYGAYVASSATAGGKIGFGDWLLGTRAAPAPVVPSSAGTGYASPLDLGFKGYAPKDASSFAANLGTGKSLTAAAQSPTLLGRLTERAVDAFAQIGIIKAGIASRIPEGFAVPSPDPTGGAKQLAGEGGGAESPNVTVNAPEPQLAGASMPLLLIGGGLLVTALFMSKPKRA